MARLLPPTPRADGEQPPISGGYIPVAAARRDGEPASVRGGRPTRASPHASHPAPAFRLPQRRRRPRRGGNPGPAGVQVRGAVRGVPPRGGAPGVPGRRAPGSRRRRRARGVVEVGGAAEPRGRVPDRLRGARDPRRAPRRRRGGGPGARPRAGRARRRHLLAVRPVRGGSAAPAAGEAVHRHVVRGGRGGRRDYKFVFCYLGSEASGAGKILARLFLWVEHVPYCCSESLNTKNM